MMRRRRIGLVLLIAGVVGASLLATFSLLKLWTVRDQLKRLQDNCTNQVAATLPKLPSGYTFVLPTECHPDSLSFEANNELEQEIQKSHEDIDFWRYTMGQLIPGLIALIFAIPWGLVLPACKDSGIKRRSRRENLNA